MELRREGGRRRERLKKRQEDRFTDTQTDGEKGRDAKRQTRADGEGRGQDEAETDGQRDPGPGERRDTASMFKQYIKRNLNLHCLLCELFAEGSNALCSLQAT